MASASKQITIEDVYSLLIKINNNLTQSIEGVERKINDLAKQIDNRFDEIHKRASKIEEENSLLKLKFKEVEKKLKSKNLIFYGIEEDIETEESLLEKIIKIFTDRLNIVNFHRIEIASAYRIGKKGHSHRPILIEFVSHFTRREIIRRRTQLQGTRIFISEDLIEEDRIERKAFVEVLKQAKRDQRKAYLKRNTIVIEGISYTYQDILQEKHIIPIQSNDYYSPPPPRNAFSGPSTPVVELEEHIEIEQNNVCQRGIEEKIKETNIQVDEEKETEKLRKLAETPGKSTGTKPKKSNIDQTQQRPLTRNRLISTQNSHK